MRTFHYRVVNPAKFLLTLWLLVLALGSLIAARPARAETPYLPSYNTISMILNYANGTTQFAWLNVSKQTVTGPSTNSFSGTLEVVSFPQTHGTKYNVTGTLNSIGDYFGYPGYTIHLDGSYMTRYRYSSIGGSNLHLDCTFYQDDPNVISLDEGSFTWSSWATFIKSSSGGGSWSGFGVKPWN